MSKRDKSSVESATRVVSTYFSAVLTLLLLNLLSLPFAWLAVSYNWPKELFLGLAFPLVVLALFLIERSYCGEKVLKRLIRVTTRVEVDVDQARLRHAVSQAWQGIRDIESRDLKALAALADRIEGVRADAQEGFKELEHAIQQAIRAVESLHGWAGAFPEAKVTSSAVQAKIDQVNRSYRVVTATMQPILSVLEELTSRIQELGMELAIDEQVRSRERANLWSQIIEAEQQLDMTLWLRVEAWYRRRLSKSHEETWRRERAQMDEMLEWPARQRSSLKEQIEELKERTSQLDGRQIPCLDDQISTLKVDSETLHTLGF